jgi:hypothetical protein
MDGILTPFFSAWSQSLVLLFGQFQPHAASADFNGMIDRLARFEVKTTAPAFSHLKQFLGVVENDPSGQRRLQIFLKKLAVPALAQHETHIDAMPSTIGASLFAGRVGRGQGPLANAADFAGEALTHGRGSFTAHALNCTSLFVRLLWILNLAPGPEAGRARSISGASGYSR